MLDVAIIGGGLAGLSLAFRLQQQGHVYALFEARERFGGRVLSVPTAADETNPSFRFDLGPSWIWPEHQPRIARLLRDFEIPCFRQWDTGVSLYMAQRDAPAQTYIDQTTYAQARRIVGGTWYLIETIVETLPGERLQLNHQLVSVADQGHHIELRFVVGTEEVLIDAKRVVVTIPPRLLIHSVAFHPALDTRLSHVMNDTATWMAGHAKAAVRFSQPFWRDAGYSGNALAAYQGAALAEIFDAGSPAGDMAGLSGFFAIPAPLRHRYRNDVEALLLEQLVRLFGRDAAKPSDITIKDWSNDRYTAVADDQTPPDGHPQYGHPWLQLDHWNDKLYFGGTETAPQFGGYLEGALESTERIAGSLLR